MQYGAQDLGVENSWRMSSVVYDSSGTPGRAAPHAADKPATAKGAKAADKVEKAGKAEKSDKTDKSAKATAADDTDDKDIETDPALADWLARLQRPDPTPPSAPAGRQSSPPQIRLREWATARLPPPAARSGQ